MAKKIEEKVADPNFKEGVKSFGASVFDGAKELGTTVYSGAKVVGSKAVDSSKQVISTVKEKSDEKGGFVNLAVSAGQSGLELGKKVKQFASNKSLYPGNKLGIGICMVFLEKGNWTSNGRTCGGIEIWPLSHIKQTQIY